MRKVLHVVVGLCVHCVIIGLIQDAFQCITWDGCSRKLLINLHLILCGNGNKRCGRPLGIGLDCCFRVGGISRRVITNGSEAMLAWTVLGSPQSHTFTVSLSSTIVSQQRYLRSVVAKNFSASVWRARPSHLISLEMDDIWLPKFGVLGGVCFVKECQILLGGVRPTWHVMLCWRGV